MKLAWPGVSHRFFAQLLSARFVCAPLLAAALLACSNPPPPAPLARLADASPSAPESALREAHPNAPASVESCIDAWLSRHHLNQYGDPPETMYPGASPLFDERTGVHTDRLEYVFARHPDLRTDCAPSNAQPAPERGQAR